MAFHLYIMRHAKSDWAAPGAADFDRALTKRGVQNAERMGLWLEENDHSPQKVISSSAVRAKQTAELVVEKLSALSEENVLYEKDLYLAAPDSLIEFIQLYKSDVSSLMVVAHNPGLEQLIHFLLNESGAKYRSMTTANIAILEYPDNTFDPAIDKGTLVEFIKPKELD